MFECTLFTNIMETIQETFWNDFDLKKPPLVTLTLQNTSFAKHVYVAINGYLQQNNSKEATEFREAAALLARLMARRKNSFRGMIGFRYVGKLNSALCRILRLDLTRDLEQFRGALPDIYDDSVSGEVPTRNNFQYVLVRLIGLHNIHKRIRECCLAAADYFAKMIRSAFFLEYNTLLVANIAKINSISQILDDKCARLYNELFPLIKHFPLIEKHKFLPENVSLPESLEYCNNDTGDETKKQNTNIEVSSLLKVPNAPKHKVKLDLGSEVERKPIAAKTTTTPNSKKFNVAQLESVTAIKKFIVNENKARQLTPKTCITQTILKHEWLGALKLFERKLLANEHSKAINIFRKFIGSKI